MLGLLRAGVNWLLRSRRPIIEGTNAHMRRVLRGSK
jgi:hypothetical protein